MLVFFFSSRRRHTRWPRDWSSDVCSSDLEAVGLAHHAVRRDAEPREIRLDRRRELRLRALEVGVVETQHEGAALAPREQRVQERGAGVADVQEPRRRGGEADDRDHGGVVACCPAGATNTGLVRPPVWARAQSGTQRGHKAAQPPPYGAKTTFTPSATPC